MGRERKPGGHVLTRWHDRQPSPHPGGTPLDIGTPAGADGGGGRGKDAEPERVSLKQTDLSCQGTIMDRVGLVGTWMGWVGE